MVVANERGVGWCLWSARKVAVPICKAAKQSDGVSHSSNVMAIRMRKLTAGGTVSPLP